MNDYIRQLSLYPTASQVAARAMAETQVPCHARKERSHSMANPMATGHTQGEPANKRRRVSLSDGVHRLTLAEPKATPYEPDTAQTTAVDSGPCYPFDHRVLKTALYNLTNNNLSRADFLVLVNRYGYSQALHSFPLATLQPSDWRAIKEQACQQIIKHNGSFLAQLPPEIITCKTCLAAYSCCKEAMFKHVPEHLKDSFFTQLVKLEPLDILKFPSEERTFKRLLTACCNTHWEYHGLFLKLPESDRTAALAIALCQRTGYGLEHIPEAQRSYELCLKACKTNGKALLHVPHRHRDEELCRAALPTYGLAYRWFPSDLAQRYDLRLLACQHDGAVLEWIPKSQHDNDLRLAACLSSGMALKFIEPEQITYEMCEHACFQDATEACRYIPEWRLDENLRKLICRSTKDPLLCDRFKPDIADFYRFLLTENRWVLLTWVPKELRSPEHYLCACQRWGKQLKLIPEQERTAEICLAACRSDGLALQWVPEEHRTPQICQAACRAHPEAYQYVPKGGIGPEWFIEALRVSGDQTDQLLTHARRVLSAADFQSLLERSVLCANHQKLTMLTFKQISSAQKEQLVEWILDPGCWPTPNPRKASELHELASPLQFSLNNPEMKHLEMAAVKAAARWTPPRYGAGQALLDEIDQTLSAATVGLPDFNEPLFQRQGVPAGGRTLRIEQGSQAFHYKFQRKGESLETLMREGVIHSVRENSPELFGQLHSKLPGATHFFRLYLDQLPTVLPTFPDPPEIGEDENGRFYVHVYRYVASTDYSIYAHVADHSQPSNPWHKGEQGILTACHDIGQFVGMGLVPTSTLPAFHDTESDREWTALHALLGYADSPIHPGTFGAWNSVATELCDFGYGGFRDVGDFEPFGKIESFLNRSDAQSFKKVHELEQSLCLVNAVCENLLAAHLIRARLRQPSSDYHYQNPKALQQTKTFIEQTLVSFLNGMYGDCQKRDSDSTFLCKWLGLKEPFYALWLSRAAVEILYWTAKQPDPAHPNLPPFEDTTSLYSHQDGYALHLNRTGRPDPKLYPDAKINPWAMQSYPKRFHNCNGQLNLGRNNSVFPLASLMCGLTRLCTGILTDNHSAMALSSE